MEQIHKYPRTRHIEGSRLQPGDHDLSAVPFRDVAGRHLVVEEKLDGANCAVSFSAGGDIMLQSRGHYLVGGRREVHFELFKQWANVHRESLWGVLGDRYVMYGEWLYAKHTIFYDSLPHYFMEFDMLDTFAGCFLSTPRRRELLSTTPVCSVPVVREGSVSGLGVLRGLVARSLYKTDVWRERLVEQAERLQLDPERLRLETDREDVSEGLYIKVEEDGEVKGRYKFVRASFLTTVVDSGSHWLNRPIVPNLLAGGVDLYAQSP